MFRADNLYSPVEQHPLQEEGFQRPAKRFDFPLFGRNLKRIQQPRQTEPEKPLL